MKMTANTIFITGGGSGIGRGLAEAFHKLGNQVIISGRRKSALDETTKANPGMASIELDLENLASIQAAAKQLTAAHPTLNVLINNAGIMLPDTAADAQDDAQLVATVTTNLIGPLGVDIRSDRPSEGSALGNDRLQHFRSCVCANGRHLRLFRHKGGASLLRPVSAIQAAGLLGKSSRTGSALGENRSDEQPRGRSGNATRCIY